MPPWARSNLPSFWRLAPVKAPGSYPNSSLSSNSCGMAAQFTFTKGFSRRSEWENTMRATTSLPVPLSPRISTVALVSATCSMVFFTSSILGLVPNNMLKSLCRRTWSRSWVTSLVSRCPSIRRRDALIQRSEVDRLGR